MTMKPVSRTLLAILAGGLILSGCDTVGPLVNPQPPVVPKTPPPVVLKPAPSTPIVPVGPTPEQIVLKEGIDLYNKGAYNEAIKRLNAPELANGAKAERVQAYKYMAFSYCVTSRQTLCRQQFEKAFKLDPAFNLQPGEHGHPLWTPQFEKAKKAK